MVVEEEVDNMEKLTCPKCDYSWGYTGDLMRATCPSCGSKVKVNEDG